VRSSPSRKSGVAARATARRAKRLFLRIFDSVLMAVRGAFQRRAPLYMKV
jgi:hypothetical protein